MNYNVTLGIESMPHTSIFTGNAQKRVPVKSELDKFFEEEDAESAFVQTQEDADRLTELGEYPSADFFL